MSSTEGYTLRGSLGLKLIVVLTIFVAIASAAKEKNPERKALYRLEYIDIQKVLDNHRMLTNFIKCFLRQGPCTPEARDFRKLLPKLAVSMCGDCSLRQRTIIKKVFNHLMINRPKEWQMLLDRFDPQRKYAERLHVFMSDNSESLYTTTAIPSKSELLKKIQTMTTSTSTSTTTTTSSTTTTTTTTSTTATPTTTITPPTDRPENPTKSPALLNNTGSENSKSDS